MISGQVMKTALSKVKSKVSYWKNYLVSSFLCASVMATTTPVNAAVTVKETTIQGADELVSTLLGFVAKMAQYIGMILLVWGVIQFIMAFRNEVADSKSRSIMVCVMAIVLISIQPIANTILSSVK